MCMDISSTVNGLVKYPDWAPVAFWPVADPGWVAMGEGIPILIRLKAQRRSKMAVVMFARVQIYVAIRLWRFP